MKKMAIKENHLYSKAYKKGQKYVGSLVSVYVLRDYASNRLAKASPKKEVVNRIGLSVSKKIGGAVERNRAKRVIRAAYDELDPILKKGFLVVIAARSAVNGVKSTDVQKELSKAFTKLGMIKAPLEGVPMSSGNNEQTESTEVK